jgi:hypothetical protein
VIGPNTNELTTFGGPAHVATPDENRPAPVKLQRIGHLERIEDTIQAIFYKGGFKVSNRQVADGTEAWPATEAEREADGPKEDPRAAGDDYESLSFSGWYLLRGQGIKGKGLAAVFGAMPPPEK